MLFRLIRLPAFAVGLLGLIIAEIFGRHDDDERYTHTLKWKTVD
jgi:hypothetical protein